VKQVKQEDKVKMENISGFACKLFFQPQPQPDVFAEPQPASFCPCLRLISFGILWFFLTLSVESSIIPLEDVIMEHRLYLPGFGAATAFATAFSLLAVKLSRAASARFFVLSAAMMVVVLGFATFQRNHVWGDTIRLWQDVAEKSPNKARPLNNLGAAFEHSGKRQEAIKAQSRAIAIDPGFYKAYYNLADLYLVSGQPEKSLPLLQTAIRLNPAFTEAYVSVGAALMRSGRFRDVIMLKPISTLELPMLFWATERRLCGSWQSFPNAIRHWLLL
jgi:tetratricopeptide (TPR) repeat protein